MQRPDLVFGIAPPDRNPIPILPIKPWSVEEINRLGTGQARSLLVVTGTATVIAERLL